MDSIFVSIHWDKTAVLTLVRSTGLAKEAGNLVFRRSLFWAALEAMDEVPLMEGMVGV